MFQELKVEERRDLSADHTSDQTIYLINTMSEVENSAKWP